MTDFGDPLPVEAIRARLFECLVSAPVVLSAPTGSGKSTQVPRWCRVHGKTLVIEPRRVACRSLAQRVAQLEGAQLGVEVGYRVRNDDRSKAGTEVLFVTPGVALRMFSGGQGAGEFQTVILDEFHERTLEVDLLLALLLQLKPANLIVMSATIEADRLAGYIGGNHVQAGGRLYPVEKVHLEGGSQLPSTDQLGGRVLAAIDRARDIPGDILVFVPGKAEIRMVTSAIEGSVHGGGLRVIPLHGGLSLEQQGRAFGHSKLRKVVVATNVAETSITIPGIGVVIDSGLVRRNSYHSGRGYLSMLPIALDSAEQRAGRAGRTGPGTCIRLWSARARLEVNTPPEVYRGSLVPLVHAAAACGVSVDSLSFLDPPHDYAVSSAKDELRLLGALDEDGITARGERLFGLPLDPGLGRILVEAEQAECLEDAIDLVATLAVGRPLFSAGRKPEDPAYDLREEGCDAIAFIRAIREGQADLHCLNGHVLQEARHIRKRLNHVFLRKPVEGMAGRVDRKRLALTMMRADPRTAYVARRRKKEVAWSAGGTEASLGRECALTGLLERPEGKGIFAAISLGSRAIDSGPSGRRIILTAAMPIPLAWIQVAGVGRERVAGAKLKGGQLMTTIEWVHARKVVATWEAVPHGALAEEGLVRLLLEGRLYKDAIKASKDALSARALKGTLDGALDSDELSQLEFENWVRARVCGLGIESGEDLQLLSADDFVAEALPAWELAELDRTHPRKLDLPDVSYELEYHPTRKRVFLRKTKGSRRNPPPLNWLPTLRGLEIVLVDQRGEQILRKR